MPQSEVSRIESGRILPTVVDIERILTALEVPSEVAAALLSLARVPRTSITPLGVRMPVRVSGESSPS
jgi:transcriptional regulator with XRE-family HTH domain